MVYFSSGAVTRSVAKRTRRQLGSDEGRQEELRGLLFCNAARTIDALLPELGKRTTVCVGPAQQNFHVHFVAGDKATNKTNAIIRSHSISKTRKGTLVEGVLCVLM